MIAGQRCESWCRCQMGASQTDAVVRYRIVAGASGDQRTLRHMGRNQIAQGPAEFAVGCHHRCVFSSSHPTRMPNAQDAGARSEPYRSESDLRPIIASRVKTLGLPSLVRPLGLAPASFPFTLLACCALLGIQNTRDHISLTRTPFHKRGPTGDLRSRILAHSSAVQRSHVIVDALTQSIRAFAARPWHLIEQVSQLAAASEDVSAGATQRMAIGAELAREIRARGWIDASYHAQELAMHEKFREAFNAVARHLQRCAG